MLWSGRRQPEAHPNLAKTLDPKTIQRSLPLLRRLYREHVAPERWRLVAALGLMAIAALATAALPFAIEAIIDLAFAAKSPRTLILIAAGTAAIFLVRGLAGYGQVLLMTRVGLAVVAGLQKRLFRHLIAADLSFFSHRAPGELISRIVNDAQLLRDTTSSLLTGIGKDSLTLIFLIAAMIWQDWLLSAISLIALPGAALGVARLSRKQRRLSASAQSETGELSALLDENFQGARQVKAYGMENYEVERAEGAIDRLFALLLRAGRGRALLYPLMEALGGAAVVAVMLYGGFQVFYDLSTPGAFFGFITALLLAYEPAKRLAHLTTQLQVGLAAGDRVFDLLDRPASVVDRSDALPLRVSGGAIRFTKVDFAYRGDLPALRGIDLEIPAGATVALVGPSGAGKSTIVSLIPRFFDVASGAITIDGQDIRAVTRASLRGAIALVSQESLLFDDTIRANILYGRPTASEAEIVAAAKNAQAWDFIAALPQGLDSQVGPRGIQLSGGERQRIVIARAILRDAPILLLDEATSSLDNASERAVQSALARLKQGRTTLVIAHRLSTVVAADRIYVLEGGSVLEQGRHAELMAAGGRYRQLYDLQLEAAATAASNADV